MKNFVIFVMTFSVLAVSCKTVQTTSSRNSNGDTNSASGRTSVNPLSIQNGSVADATYWGVGALQNADGKNLCTAFLACPTMVVTAAHCFDNSASGPLPAVFSRPENKSYPRVATVFEVTPNNSIETQDIAVVKLAGKAVDENWWTNFPDITTSDDQVKNGDNATIVGYGLTEDPASISTRRQGTVIAVSLPPGPVPKPADDFNIYKANDSKQMACPGDSGGPVLVNNVVQGVISRVSPKDAGCGKYTVLSATPLDDTPIGAGAGAVNASGIANNKFLKTVLDTWCERSPSKVMTVNGALYLQSPSPTNPKLPVIGDSASSVTTKIDSPQQLAISGKDLNCTKQHAGICGTVYEVDITTKAITIQANPAASEAFLMWSPSNRCPCSTGVDTVVNPICKLPPAWLTPGSIVDCTAVFKPK